jgi:hypothetical protein
MEPFIKRPVSTFRDRKMKMKPILLWGKCQTCLVMALALFSAGDLASKKAKAQEIDFGKIEKFESLVTGTLHVGSPPKTIVDDNKRHVIILTIWDADAETKVYWKSVDESSARTTIIPGNGIQTFKIAGEFRLEAIGKPNGHVNYGYVLLGLKTQK